MSTLNKSTHKHNGSVHNKTKEFVQQKIYLHDDYLLVIYHAQFYQKYLLLCTKQHLVVYQIERQVMVNQLKLKTHCASFIPHTNYIAFVHYQDEKQKKNGLSIWDYKVNKIISKMEFSFQIESLKTSHRCIILSSLSSLYVIHFPTLKPIYNNFAGNGFNIVYDISQQGLTLVFNNHKKGQLTIRNITNIQTNKLLTQIKSNKLQLNDRIKANSSRRSIFNNYIQNKEQQSLIKQIIEIKAHSDNISLLRLSTNGYRVISCSCKGSPIRLFSCLTGELMSQYSMSLTTIIDIKFIPQGNSIVCLNDFNQVNLFHTKMIEEEVISQKNRRGCQIYQIENPKSFFSFLWFLNDKFRFDRPFAYLTLSTSHIKHVQPPPSPQIQQKKVKLQKTVIQTIQQERHEHDSHIYQEQSKQPIRITIVQQKQQKIQQGQFKKIQISPQQNTKLQTMVSSSKQLPLDVIMTNTKQQQRPFRTKSINRQSNESIQMKLQKLSSRKKSDMSILKQKGASIKSILTAKKHTETIQMKHVQKDLNFKGIIDFSGNININVIRCKYFYKLKYDPFNGGCMFQSKSFNLLHHPVFKQL